jgi:TetR/AcrR family tetracycline transcriptional repressor
MPRKRGGTQPSPIVAADVIEAALRVVARSSLDSLTVRAVADECEVSPPAIHYHLRGGGNLADRVVEAVAARIDFTIDPEMSWVDQYLGLISAMDRGFLAYPGTGLHALTSTGRSDAAADLSEIAIGILRAGGLTENAALEVFAATYLMFAGWLATRNLAEGNGVHPSLVAARAAGLGQDDDKALQAAMRRVLILAEGDRA